MKKKNDNEVSARGRLKIVLMDFICVRVQVHVQISMSAIAGEGALQTAQGYLPNSQRDRTC